MAESFVDSDGYELASWAEPLIFDRLVEHYFGLDAWGVKDTAGLVHFHGQMWQAILRGESTLGAELRGKLLQVVARTLLSPSIVEQADRLVFAELIAVASQRFRRSRLLTRAAYEALDQVLRHFQAEARAEPVEALRIDAQPCVRAVADLARLDRRRLAASASRRRFKVVAPA